MPSWGETLDEVNSREQNGEESVLDHMIRERIAAFSAKRGRNVICYYSSWLQKPNRDDTGINDLDMNGFVNAVKDMDRSKGLDLVLHTPGGAVAATESVISYLHGCFGRDMVAFVPQLAMSGGTMMACACREIYMGRQSSIGPTDPQFGGTPASGIVEEFQKAVESVRKDPGMAALWGTIIGKYPPAYIGESEKALRVSAEILSKSLKENMFAENPEKVDEVVSRLTSHADSGMHDRHFSIDTARSMGLIVKTLEDDDVIQDMVLSIHHVFMILFHQSNAVKIISSGDHAWVINASN